MVMLYTLLLLIIESVPRLDYDLMLLRYIGRSHDPFGKRVNQGYGQIAPKNCYLGGQATNCHLNALIAENTQNVSFYVCPIMGDQAIDSLERELIHHYHPSGISRSKHRNCTKLRDRAKSAS